MIKLARPLYMKCLNGSNYFSLSFVVITPFKGHFLSSRKLQSWTKPVEKIYRHVQFWFYKNEFMPFIHYNPPFPLDNVGFSSHVM